MKYIIIIFSLLTSILYCQKKCTSIVEQDSIEVKLSICKDLYQIKDTISFEVEITNNSNKDILVFDDIFHKKINNYVFSTERNLISTNLGGCWEPGWPQINKLRVIKKKDSIKIIIIITAESIPSHNEYIYGKEYDLEIYFGYFKYLPKYEYLTKITEIEELSIKQTSELIGLYDTITVGKMTFLIN